ncbi:MAG: class I SAM-dependent methyltransferase [Patescibacteria group bacterium]|nr:class I SAM-dependent methyltransferase [Patescibacteria group bacterium]MDE2589960.1 class I SAM-dependent methyltransferase [Patescibacteria group bacterium]
MRITYKYLLDIGCGRGYRTFQLSKKPYTHVFGIDLSKENISLAKKRYPGVKFSVMNAQNLRFKTGMFDSVYAVDVLEHVNNVEAVLRGISNIVKKNGSAVIIVPGERSEQWLQRLRPTYFKEIHHVRIFKKGKMEKLFAQYGFTLKTKKATNFLQHLELYYFFKTSKQSACQLEIGSWNNNMLSMGIHALVASFDPYWVFHSPLKYIPIWLLTLPVGIVGNYFGNKYMPKSMYYEFVKK